MDELLRNFDVIRTPGGLPQVEVGGRLSIELTHSGRDLNLFVADRTVQMYYRCGIALFGAVDAIARRNGGSIDAWSRGDLALLLWKQTLEALGCTLKRRPGEYWFRVTVPELLRDFLPAALSAATHLYSAAHEQNLAAWHPLRKRPPESRHDVVSMFRIVNRVASVRRTGPPLDVVAYQARIAERCPPNVVMLVDLLVGGLARISEEIRLSVLDWGGRDWGAEIDTPNKRDGEQRTKVQRLSGPLHARATLWFDEVRVDPHGHTRSDWDRLLRTPEGRDLASRTPLIPNRRLGFYSYSGVVDVHLRPACAGGFEHVVPHMVRIAGINEAVDYIEALPISDAAKEEHCKAFAREMGWKMPDEFLAYYTAQRRAAKTAALVMRIAEHREQAIAARARSPETLLGNGVEAPKPQSGRMARMLRLAA